MKKIIIGLGSCGIASGGLKVKETLQTLANEAKADVTLGETGCMGMCYKEPMIEIYDEDNGSRTIYGDVSEKTAKKIFDSHILNNVPFADNIVLKSEGGLSDHTQSKWSDGSETNFLSRQKRIVLERCGAINPESIDDALKMDAYKGL